MTYKKKLIDLLKSDKQVKELYENQEDLWCSSLITDGINNLVKIDKQLQERFIRMYCKNKKIKLSINNQVIDNYGIHILFINNNGVCEIDNLKDFNNQDDEVYQKIYELLNNLKVYNENVIGKALYDLSKIFLEIEKENK